MLSFLTYLAALMFMVLLTQGYFYAQSLSGSERQSACLKLGIFYTTLGVCALAFHKIVFVVSGLILLMLGLRLIAYGLDRIDKTIFIDRYTPDSKPDDKPPS